MYFKILFNYILGYVNIQIEGYFVEKLINKCISKGVFLWNIKRTKSTIAFANIGIKDFKRLKTITKEVKCKTNIISKKGLPFIFHKYRKRKFFFAFFILLIIVVAITSRFIWNIDIIGNSRISKEELLQTLKDNGLKVGEFKDNIRTKEIVDNIRLKRDDIAWIGVEIKGTNAIVKVVEADEKPEIIDENDFCNIVATKPGIIVKVNALNRHSRSKRRRCCKGRKYSNRRLVRRQIYRC